MLFAEWLNILIYVLHATFKECGTLRTNLSASNQYYDLLRLIYTAVLIRHGFYLSATTSPTPDFGVSGEAMLRILARLRDAVKAALKREI